MFEKTDRSGKMEIGEIRKMFSLKIKEDDLSQSLSGAHRIASTSDLTLGDNKLPPPNIVTESIVRAAQAGDVKYSNTMGDEDLRTVLASAYKERYGIDLDNENVITASGGLEILSAVAFGYVEYGTNVLIVDPSFLMPLKQARAMGGKLHFLPTHENDFEINTEMLKQYLSEYDIDLLYYVDPSNPSGSVQEEETIKGLVEICKDYKVGIISDNVYWPITFDSIEHTSPLEFDYDDVIVVDSFSKWAGISGCKLGFGISKNKDLIKGLAPGKSFSTVSSSTLMERAMYYALEDGSFKNFEDYFKLINTEFQKRRDLLAEGLNNIGLNCITPKGSFYIYADTENTGADGIKISQHMLRYNVKVVGGLSFGDPKNNKHFTRLSYAGTNENDIKIALGRMELGLKELK